ncbi:MAG: tRNA-dihydrouridine synthase [bacterium]
MSQSFWKNLSKPIFVLAPMADVTDAAFRQIIAKWGKPDVMWTEFVSADGLALAPEKGRQKLLKNLEYTEAERPIVAQFFTANPEHMEKAAKLADKLGFDGVDINMGCPDRRVEKQGAGASLMKNPNLARELIRATRRGAPNLPVSVKTRTGYSKPDLEKWLPKILEEEPAVVIIHARTRKEMSKVSARWEYVKLAVEIRDKFALRPIRKTQGKQTQGENERTLIFGNGDIRDLRDAQEKVEKTGCDGVMLGRAIFGNPFLFAKKKYPEGIEGLKLKLEVLVEHAKLFEKLLGGTKSFSVMKKHFKAYLSGKALAASDTSGFNGVGELRAQLMETENAEEVERIVKKFLKTG